MAKAGKDQPIVIKRIKKGGHAHHGGAWKIAYADFVTAMMAFFLLMWLVSVASDEQKAGLAEYFTTGEVTDKGAQVLVGSMGILSDAGPTIDIQNINQSDEALQAAEAELEERQFEQAQDELEDKIASTPGLEELAKNLVIQNTPEGLEIQLIDQENVAMFPSGDYHMTANAEKLVAMVSQVVKKMPQKLSIAGHTDAIPFTDKSGYGNWELSADRALAARRELIRYGIPADKIDRVMGRADSEPFLKDKPTAPQNRRIGITLLRHYQMKKEGDAATTSKP